MKPGLRATVKESYYLVESLPSTCLMTSLQAFFNKYTSIFRLDNYGTFEMKIGIIGCGNISETYFKSQNLYNYFNVVACADINLEASRESAKKFGIQFQSVEDLLTNQNIELIAATYESKKENISVIEEDGTSENISDHKTASVKSY